MRLLLPAGHAPHPLAPLSAGRLVNCYPEPLPEGAAAPTVLRPTPGLVRFAQAGGGPVHALAWLGETPLALSGDGVYELAADGTATLWGRTEGRTPPQLAEIGAEAVIVRDGRGWVVDAATRRVGEIVDPDFPGSASVTALDGWFVHAAPGSGGRWFLSRLRDGGAYDALDFATAEALPDDLVRVVAEGRVLYLFGRRSTELWFNAGGADFPFARDPGGALPKGLAGPRALAQADGAVWFLADDGAVWRAAGPSLLRVSTAAIERLLADEDPALVTAWAWDEPGHGFLAFRGAAGATPIFDRLTGAWHMRTSQGRRGEDATTPPGPWRVGSALRAFGRVLAGDATDGTVWALDDDAVTEDGAPLRRVVEAPPLDGAGRTLMLHGLEAEWRLPRVPEGLDPEVRLDWSDDGGRTWVPARTAPMGRRGVFDRRTLWRRLGRFRARVLRLTVEAPVAPTLLALTARLGVADG